MTAILDDAAREFLVESHENLDRLDQDLMALEAEPGRIASVFRTVHTVKGTAAFLGYGRLERLAHVGETLLALVRSGECAVTPAVTSSLLALVDRIRGHLRTIESTAADDPTSDDELKARLMAHVPGADAPRAASSPPAPMAPPPSAPVIASPPPAPVAVAPPAMASVTPATPVAAAPAVATAAPSSGESEDGSRSGVVDTSVRVDVRLLDRLMNLVGELVLARNRILQFSGSVADPAFVSASQRLNFVATELQEGVMKTRMQPIGTVWNKLPRIVRDVATSCGKQVRIEMHGKDTELDRTLIEAIKDPLTHIVRNAIDHGVEAAEVRMAAGKPRTGTLTLRSFHEGGQVHIEVSDDGAGLKTKAIRDKAIQLGLITAERAATLSDRDIHQFVFLPGFSTAQNVTALSGRGVGMDVVKTNIERIGGTIELLARPGAGTTVRIKIPLTLAIVPALVVRCAGQRFAVPQVSLIELVRLDSASATRNIERLHDATLYRLRGNLLPLVRLDGLLGLEPADAQAPANMLVLQADGRQFGIVVDSIEDSEEIVVKALGPELKSLAVYAGATIMGDGGIALILDVIGLARKAGIATARDAIQTAATATAETRDAGQSLLLMRVGDTSRVALPLSAVARLEEFPRDAIESVGRRNVMQYRGDILPLVDVSAALGTGASSSRDGPVAVVVTATGFGQVGLMVDNILDIVAQDGDLRPSGRRRGVLGSAIIHGHITEVLDVESIVEQGYV